MGMAPIVPVPPPQKKEISLVAIFLNLGTSQGLWIVFGMISSQLALLESLKKKKEDYIYL